MPMRSIPIFDKQGNRIGVACTRVRRLNCSTAGCHGEGTLLCDYPVTRRGRLTTCNRRVCHKCGRVMDTDATCRERARSAIHYCPPHVRLYEQGGGVHGDATERKVLEEFFPGAAAEQLRKIKR